LIDFCQYFPTKYRLRTIKFYINLGCVHVQSTRRNVKFNILEFETRKTEHRYRFVMLRQGAWPELKTRDHEWEGKPASVVNSEAASL